MHLADFCAELFQVGKSRFVRHHSHGRGVFEGLHQDASAEGRPHGQGTNELGKPTHESMQLWHERVRPTLSNRP